MKRLAGLSAFGAVTCFLTSFAGAVGLLNISWSAVLLLFSGAIVCTVSLNIFQQKNPEY